MDMLYKMPPFIAILLTALGMYATYFKGKRDAAFENGKKEAVTESSLKRIEENSEASLRRIEENSEASLRRIEERMEEKFDTIIANNNKEHASYEERDKAFKEAIDKLLERTVKNESMAKSAHKRLDEIGISARRNKARRFNKFLK